MFDREMSERRYEETMEAIHSWTKGLGEGAMLPEEAIGIAKAFLTHASMAIASATSSALSEADEGVAERSWQLRKDLFDVVAQFFKERTGERGS